MRAVRQRTHRPPARHSRRSWRRPTIGERGSAHGRGAHGPEALGRVVHGRGDDVANRSPGRLAAPVTARSRAPSTPGAGACVRSAPRSLSSPRKRCAGTAPTSGPDPTPAIERHLIDQPLSSPIVRVTPRDAHPPGNARVASASRRSGGLAGSHAGRHAGRRARPLDRRGTTRRYFQWTSNRHRSPNSNACHELDRRWRNASSPTGQRTDPFDRSRGSSACPGSARRWPANSKAT